MGDCGQNGRPVNPSLIDLPPELLLIAIGLLSAADQRRLAKTCTLLRAAVLQQAKQLQLDIGSHDYPASAALLAAIRREHGPPLHLELRFRVWFEGQHINVMKELSALGTCPAVHQLELACIAVSREAPVTGNRGKSGKRVCFVPSPQPARFCLPL
jgi:hypothetical protein